MAYGIIEDGGGARTKQPPGPLLLTEKAAWVFLPTVPVELVSKTPITYGSSGATYSADEGGRALDTTASAGGNLYAEIAHSTQIQIPSGPAVFVMRVKMAANLGARISKTTANGATDNEFDFIAYEYLGAGVLTVALTRVGGGGSRAWGVLESVYRPPANKWVTLAVYAPSVVDSASVFFADGVRLTATDLGGSGSGAPDTSTQPIRFNKRDDLTTSNDQAKIAVAYVIPGGNEAMAQRLSRNPWQLFEADNDPVFYSLGAGGSNNTATLSSTLDAATLTGVGAVTRSGTLAVTLDSATLAGVGGVTRSGTLSSTLDAATLSGAGTVAVGTNRDGTLASTLADVTLTGIGAVTRSGTLSATLDAATLAGSGSVGQPCTGTLSVTLDNVTLRGIGAIPAAPSTGGGKTTGKNLSRKQKKKLKAVESQEWLKAEETARQLLSDRFTKQTPQEKAQALETYIESLQPVIEALKALTSQIEEVVEEAPVIELTPHQEVIQRFDRLEKKVKSVEELIIILMADL